MDGGDCRTAPATPGLLNSVVIDIVIESMHGATSRTRARKWLIKRDGEPDFQVESKSCILSMKYNDHIGFVQMCVFLRKVGSQKRCQAIVNRPGVAGAVEQTPS